MLLSPIHFGKKIPVSNCKIKDIQRNKAVDATLYEFDCQDFSDIEEVMNIQGEWNYKEDVVSRMLNVYNTKNFKKSSMAFYTMENPQGEVIGLSQIKKENPDIVLNYLESKQDGKYKYIGQNLISFLCNMALEEGYKRIYIPIPTKSAYDFYTKKCGFKKIWHDCALAMSQIRMKIFKKKTDKLNEKLPKMDSNHR